MDYTANQDSFLFFSAILLGFLIGFYYEIFRFLRLALPHPGFLVFLEDLLFLLPLSPVLIFFHYALSDGILRWFSLTGCLLGFLLYLGTVGKLLLRFSAGILFCIRAVLKWLFRFFVLPPLIVFKNITNYLYAKWKSTVIILRKNRDKKLLKRKKKLLSRYAEKGFQ
ncbi:MAG: hypothetical protein E7580_06900 [Ruminococcaceae bacterium]|nr:hypothetical protein [Oscillospiraceae bacterium]